MKPIAAGLTIIGAAAVALGVSAATAWADGSSWSFSQDPGTVADLVQSPARSQLAWEVPGAFTNTDTGAVVSGDLFIRPTGGALLQPDFQFDVPNSDVGSAMYAYGSPTGSGYGVAAYFYSPHGTSDVTGSAGQFLTGGNGIHLGPGMTWLLGPADYSKAITADEALSKVMFGQQGVLDLGSGNTSSVDTWTMQPGPGSDQLAMTPVMYNNMPIWSFDNVTFTDDVDGKAPDGLNGLNGTVYLNTTGLATYNEEFVTADHALYDVNQWGLGFTNLYYAPGNGGSVVDTLKTPFGDWNVSWLSWLFTPPDYSGTSATEASKVLSDLLINPVLSDAFEFGQATQAAAAAADSVGSL